MVRNRFWIVFALALAIPTVAAAQSTPRLASQAKPVAKKRVDLQGIVTGVSRSGTESASRSATNYGTLPGKGGQFGGAMVAGPANATSSGSAATGPGGEKRNAE